MSDEKLPEVWLRGPVDGICAELQPVAHALLQAREEVISLMEDFPEALLWIKPGGLASPAFHLQHIAGVIDRLITYKNESPLSQAQLLYLKNEGVFDDKISTGVLVETLKESINFAITELTHTEVNILAAYRGVGRRQLPSTVGGLLFHIAEHTMRHTGQLLVTVHVLKNGLKL